MEKLEPPDSFPFPFSPYSIQHDFMSSLYNVLEEGKLGIFESPTGTGKSLSLICGSLTWLQDHDKNERERLEQLFKTLSVETDHSNGGDPFDWLNQQAEQVQVRQRKAETKRSLEWLDKYNEKLSTIKKASKQRKLKTSQVETSIYMNQTKVAKKSTEDVKNIEEEDEDILLEEYEDDVRESVSEDDESNEQCVHQTKIYFCSRTHSQLAQFIGELQRSPFGKDVRVVPLASRQNSCVNENVSKLKSLPLINERCLDLQRKNYSKTATSEGGKTLKKACKRESSSGCPAMNRNAVTMLSEDILTEIQDVEQIVRAGRKTKACPYYASRASIGYAQVVVVPYNTLLHKSTREACGIQIKNNIVIIDEAHNLLEAIGNIYSAQVTGYQLSHCHSQLVQYRDRYQSRFNPKTLLHLGQLIFIVGKLIRILGGKAGGDPNDAISKVMENKIYTLQNFVLTSEIDNLNLFKLLEFCRSSKISHKLHGFTVRYQTLVNVSKQPVKNQGIRAFLKGMESTSNKAAPSKIIEDEPKTTSANTISDGGNNPFLSVMAFLETLTNSCDDGRILLKRGMTVGKGVLKFLLLNPAAHFEDIVQQARSVVVAGGTMQPLSEFQDQLFLGAGGNPDRIAVFSCGHIIPPQNILPITLGSGPSGKSFDFSFTHRDSAPMLTELGRLLINVCNIVPAGVVCFFPSYDYEKNVLEHFDKTGVLGQIESKKKVFREPKLSSEVENVLSSYASCISHASSKSKLSGAILFSVIGGKLSEGLNFSDDLGRCVMVIGLPFPNIKSVELQEQMKYLDSTVGSGGGQRHYENLCMKAVNQSIGRAVRHKDDYAAVLLIDQRYLQPTRQKSLPNWIQRSLEPHDRFSSAFASLRKFFQNKKSIIS